MDPACRTLTTKHVVPPLEQFLGTGELNRRARLGPGACYLRWAAAEPGEMLPLQAPAEAAYRAWGCRGPRGWDKIGPVAPGTVFDGRCLLPPRCTSAPAALSIRLPRGAPA